MAAKKKESEIVVLAAEEITQPLDLVVQKTKVNVPLAQQHAAAFAPFMMQYHELSSVLKNIDKENPTEEDSAKARRARLDLVKVRGAAEDIKDDRKQHILIESDLIQSLYNVVKNTCMLTESELMAIEKTQERKENDRLNLLEKERLDLLSPFDEDARFLDLKHMDQDHFDRYLNRSKLAFELEAENKRLAEEKRIADEKEAEKKRLAKEEADKKERERVAAEHEKLRLENLRLREEQKEKDRLAQIEKDKLLADQKKKDDAAALELKKANDLAASKEKFLAAIRAKGEADKKIAAEKEAAEKKRLKDIEDKRIAEEKAAALAPDKKKLRAWFDKFIELKAPEMTSKEGKELAKSLDGWLADVRTKLIAESNKLK